MRVLAFCAGIVLLASPSRAATCVYLSVAGENRIAAYEMDEATGKLTHRQDVPTSGGPGSLTVDPQRRFLLAAIRSTGKLASFRIDPKTGNLTAISEVPAGMDPAYVATDRTGRFLLTAYYVAAKVTVHRIGNDGELSPEPLQSLPTAINAHAILADPSNRFVFVPHTGPTAIFQFRFDAERGRLVPNEPDQLSTGPDTGPRHVCFHTTLSVAYFNNEQGCSVTAYAMDTEGHLKPLQTLSTLPAGVSNENDENSTAGMEITPDGRFLYVSNRGHDSLAAFAVDPETGRLSSLGQTATEKTPRGFGLSPHGNFLFAAGESSGKLAAYRVAETGQLTRLATYDVGQMPWWVQVVEMP